MSLQRRQRARRVLELRRDCVPFQQIADQEGVSLSTVYDDFQKAMKEITAEPAEDVLRMELERLAAMHLRLSSEIARVTSQLKKDPETVNLSAVDQVRKLIDSQVRISERRAKLLGLDITKHEATDTVLEALATGFELLDGTTVEELDPAGDF